ncbi:hypothetical protein BGX38DRAFT_1276257 [Terfezia claveryi]|nr:hypothetical protein BGX38DRAFT_1276257 [Terfezia claveryi]
MASLILACISCCRPQNRRGGQSSPPLPKRKRHSHKPTVGPRTGPRLSEDYTFQTLKVENERRVRKLGEAGLIDVPHGVLSKEVGTPEVVPRYEDVVGVDEWGYRFVGKGVGGGNEDGVVEGVRGGNENGVNGVDRIGGEGLIWTSRFVGQGVGEDGPNGVGTGRSEEIMGMGRYSRSQSNGSS